MSKNRGITISIASDDKKQVITSSAPIVKIQGKPIQQKVDLVFTIDTTGSMSDKIESLLATCEKFVDEFATLNLDYRVAIVAFGDLTVPGDRIERTAFTDKVGVVRKSLRNIPRYSGGGNEGESSLEALGKAMGLPFRPNTVKVIILITDEPAHQHRVRASDVISRILQEEFLAFVVSPAIAYFKDMARKSGGKWYRVAANTDFTDLLSMFQQIAKKVSKVVSDVHELSDGNVSDYLRLRPPEEKDY